MIAHVILCDWKLVGVTDSLQSAKRSLEITHSKQGNLTYRDNVMVDNGLVQFPSTVAASIGDCHYHIVPIDTAQFPCHL